MWGRRARRQRYSASQSLVRWIFHSAKYKQTSILVEVVHCLGSWYQHPGLINEAEYGFHINHKAHGTIPHGHYCDSCSYFSATEFGCSIRITRAFTISILITMGELEWDKVNEHTRNNQGSLESQSSYSWSVICPILYTLIPFIPRLYLHSLGKGAQILGHLTARKCVGNKLEEARSTMKY